MKDYWIECISEAFCEANIAATKEQIETVASWAECAHDNFSMATGSDCIPNPLAQEIIEETMKPDFKEIANRLIGGWCSIPSLHQSTDILVKAIAGEFEKAYAAGRADEAKERGWQPIESAPHDFRVDLWVTYQNGKGCRAENMGHSNGKWRGDRGPLNEHHTPSHWMPIPKGPDAETGRGTR